MAKTISPEVRNELIRYMSGSVEVYLRELTSRYFRKNPASAENRQIMLDAIAIALQKLMADDPHAPAVLRTFALEILEQETRQ